MRNLPNFRGFSNWGNDGIVKSGLTFGDVGFNSLNPLSPWMYTSRSIKGINKPIDIQVNYNQNRNQLYYSIDYTVIDQDYNLNINPPDAGFNSIADTASFTVYPGEYINFGADSGNEEGISFWVTLKNGSDNDKIISYINMNWT